jgi:hypothetical protein
VKKEILSFVLGALVVSGEAAGQEAAKAKAPRLEVRDRESLAAFNVVPTNGTIRVTFSNPANNSGVELELKPGETHCALRPEGFFAKELRARMTTQPCAEFAEGKPHWVSFKRTEMSWLLYLDDAPVARLPELWDGPVAVTHPDGEMPAADMKDDYAQRLGHFTFADNFLVPAGSEFPATWEKMAGIWKLHSVTGSISGASGGYQLARQPRPEKSPNFYTLEGGGTNALVLAGEPFYGRYSFRASVQHNSGTNGIAFLAGERGGYFAFTAQTDAQTDRLILELWRQPADPAAPREYLDAVQTELPAGQWLSLEARVFDDRVLCFADKIEVIRRKMPLPPSGRFGLYANTEAGETTRFDDVVAASHEDLPLETPEDVALVTRTMPKGVQTFYHKGATWFAFPSTDGTNAPTVWTAGAPDYGPMRQETRFIATTKDFMCGLTAGATNDAAPYYRFSCEQRGDRRRFRLEEVSGQFAFLQDSFETPATNNTVTLKLDALREGELRASADGRMVCFTRPATQPGGIQGMFGAGGGDILFAKAPDFASTDDTQVERFEKNPLYVNDPYMRHWASPEGQWVTFPNGLTWFKGDITGPVTIRLPVVKGMELHLCVPEDSSNGLCRVTVASTNICVYTPDSGTNAAITVPVEKVPDVAIDKEKAKIYTLGLNGSVVWLGGDEVLLGQAHISKPLAGRRLRIAGMALENLAQTLVKRDNVFDTLFTESLYNWTINGGRWEVINRFYCEPTWSHMNGESSDSLAALWSKYVFSGDFSIEFYAGMRMGWYARPGDLNLTVMSRKCSPSDGYTAIATGWDPDHSQLYSRLLRNGKPMAISTKYLVPRSREGLERKGYQPLVAKGRDYHGAWYGMQLRRVGHKLQYIYDNEEVFNVEDADPLEDGALGIWTFCNSMMVARIKIAAESIKPRPFEFHPIKAGAPLAVMPSAPADSGLRVNGRVPELLTPAYWEAFDTVSHPSVRFSRLDTQHPQMRVTSILGGGTFLVRCSEPPAEADKLLGWRFEIARHPEARVNFEFTAVTKNDKGEFVPVQGWTYVLSGSDEERGPRKICGKAAAIPPSEGTNTVWTPVEVWVPSEIIRAKQQVRIEGFGNLQPSDVQQGLEGNPPHAWYAIRSFREIHRGVPVITGPADKHDGIAEFAKLINSLPPGEMQMVEAPEALDPLRPVIEWAVPELASFGLKAVADAAIPGSILISPTHPWPSPLLPPKKALTDAQPAPFIEEGDAIRVLVPYGILQPKRMTLALELSDGRFFRQVVPMQDEANATNHPPVLLSLEMPEGGIQTFEQRPFDLSPYKIGTPTAIDYTDPQHGGVLKFRNAGVYGRRLSGQLLRAFDPVATPLVQFRYRGDAMARVALNFGGNGMSFSEAYNRSLRFHHDKDAPVDGTWHTWMGIPTDDMGTLPLAARTSVPASYLRIGSMQGADQTGLHSTIEIDDLACGPAVGPNRVLAFKADFADPDGVAQVAYAILQGPVPFDDRPAAETAKLTWVTAKNATVIQPDIANVPDGFHHLLVRACDTPGLWSVPSDVPFVLDRKPPDISFNEAPCPEYNGRKLTAVISDGISPPVLNTLHFACLGRALDLSKDNGTLGIGEGTLGYTIDWVWMLRPELEAGNFPNGVLPVSVSGIADAAGNTHDPVVINIKPDIAADKRAPTVLPLAQPANTILFEPSLSAFSPTFTAAHGVNAAVVEAPCGPVLDLVAPEEKSAYIQRAFPAPWDPDKFPWLALSFRVVDGDAAPNGPFSLAFHAGQRRPRGIKDAQMLSLGEPANNAFIVAATPIASWKPGEWQDVLINARDFLRAETTDHKETPDITYLTIYLRPRLLGKHIQIRSISVLAPWNSDVLLPLRPYDLSGVKGLVWEGGTSPLTGIRPANLVPPAATPHWFDFRISDKRGNLTPTWAIPVPPDSEKSKPALQGLEKVEY